MIDKFLNMMGLCARAGKCLYGETACLNGIRMGKVELMVIDENTSDNTRKRFTDACTFRSIPLITCSQDIGNAVGKPGRKLIAVSDKAFAKMLLQLTQSVAER